MADPESIAPGEQGNARVPRRMVTGFLPGATGPDAAYLFHRLFALVSLGAWLSLAAQVKVLIGPRGLLPLAEFLTWLARQDDLPAVTYPSLLRFEALTSDGALVGVCLVGALLSLLALANVRPRVCFVASTILYLSCVCAARTFMTFQWDNLLLEMGMLAAILPADRRAPLAHLLLRLLLFKLYVESGIAKWQSPLHDWQDGSAMTFYYETAPLPAWPAFFAHHLPAGWHAFEGWATLVVELVVPFFAFGPRFLRRVALVGLTGFQLINFATANYGFFVLLALVLHVFLLDEDDAVRVLGFAARGWARVRRVRTALPPVVPAAAPVSARAVESTRLRTAKAIASISFVAFFVVASLVDALAAFSDFDLTWTQAARSRFEPLRLVNTYHLFASITRERIEPEVQTLSSFDGGAFTARNFHHKPGDLRRRPDFVAPHQPRVDFQMWFYGLRFRRPEPAYVANLIRRVCVDPEAVQPLFATRLPHAPAGVRLVFHQYNFTSRDEKRRDGLWWRRTEVGATRTVSCDEFRDDFGGN